MSAPTLWIFLPFFVACILLIPRNQKFVIMIACVFTLFLTLAAWLIPIDTILNFGHYSFKLSSSINILGRSFILTSANRSLLALIYGSSILWFASSLANKAPKRFIPLGLAITSLLVAAIAVVPFLYAALLIEMAVLLSVPLLSIPGQKPGKGLIRFLIFQTIAMPFILFSGWLLAGIDANPGDLGLVQQVAILIALGFSFLLAVFPFYSWIPMLTEESSPYAVAFILWMFSTVTIFFGLGFLDRYTWLRDSPSLEMILISVGILMIVTGGLLAAFQRHLGRIMGYAVIMENGFSLIAISLGIKSDLSIFYMLLIPRLLSLLIWAFSLSILKENYSTLDLDSLKGVAHTWPFASSGLVIANLALAGMPLLAGFPSHLAIWEGLASSSISTVAWVLMGSIGLIIGSLRTLRNFVTLREESPWGSRETLLQNIILFTGTIAIILLGFFPNGLSFGGRNFQPYSSTWHSSHILASAIIFKTFGLLYFSHLLEIGQMEFEQIIKRLDWLDDEHRKDKEIIIVLTQQISSLEGDLKTSAKKIKDLTNQISKLSSAPARIEQYDSALTNQRTDLLKYIDNQDKKRQENLSEIDKRYQFQFDILSKSLADLQKLKDPIIDLKQELKTHSDDDVRRGKLVAEWEVRMKAMVEVVEDVKRNQKVAEEPRRQDSKRLADLQGELSAARKRLDETRQKNDLFSDNIRRVETRLNEILISEAERRQAQTAFIESQSMLQIERDHAWKEWQGSLESIRKQSGIMDRYFQDWEVVQRTVKRDQETYQDIVQKFERRINEITEMQRLAEDRFRQEWVTFKADDQKRWTSFTLSQDETHKDTRSGFGKLEERLKVVEDLAQIQQDIIQQTKDANQQMFQGMIAQIHEVISAYERITTNK